LVMRLPRLSGSENDGDGSLGVLLDDSGDGVDVFLVLGETTVSDLVLAVGCKRRAVTVRQVVDDESAHDRRGSASGVLRLDVSKVSVHGRDFGGGVKPHERADFGNSACLGHQARRQRRDSERLNLRSVVRVGVDLLASEWVA